MGILHIDEVKAGQTLGEDILTPQGMKIASTGNEISDRHLKAFKAWGVTEVCIQGETTSTKKPEKGKLICNVDCQAAVKIIDQIFSKTNRDDPVIRALYAAVVKRATAE